MAIAVLIGACDDGPAGPVSLPPVLTDFSYTIEDLNLEACPPSNLENSSRFRWTIHYDDANGDVVAPLQMLWSTSFSPSGFTKAALLLLPSNAISGDGYSGTIAQTQCLRFVEETAVDITVSILDAEGNHSEPRTLHIDRPTGALAPTLSGVRSPR